ncbi:RNA polymerase sigma-70 factor, ECF subfamily [Draconibacterium orientale]|uniref:RNA polymerase n=1 Tax=Draconibacterium orientale TaxID=1168034 RepID=X5DUK5_9BACT|nr:RNA polymerase sigma-70 factor [Draconibacterium orientale]AHW58850.1 RNA polymerase [Draconibacterium orientale]SET93583.1 RNA polymerase sigma-70 factor, ECF subfamily [Draconibacterium orientale]
MSLADSNMVLPDLTSFKKGDEHAFKIIFEDNYDRIVGFCLQFIPDREEAKNIAQQSFVKLWLNREEVNTINGICAFLYTAAKTECLNFLRHEKYKSEYQKNTLKIKENLLNRQILESFHFNKLEYQELEGMIQLALEKLPERCRIVFEKSRFEGKKNREIADELGIAIKSVESNITRAIKILRKELRDILPFVLWML